MTVCVETELDTIYNYDELESIGKERIQKIKEDAIRENMIHYERQNVKDYVYATNTNKLYPNKAINRSRKHKYIFFHENTQLTHRIEYLSFNATKYKLQNDIEKKIFLINGIFPDDEKYIDSIQKANKNQLVQKLVKLMVVTINSKNDNEKYKFWLRQLTIFLSKNQDEICEFIKYFQKFHGVESFSLIMNRLLQVYYYNNDLYNSYLSNKEVENSKKVKQKILV